MTKLNSKKPRNLSNYQWVYGLFNPDGELIKLYIKESSADKAADKKGEGWCSKELFCSLGDPF